MGGSVPADLLLLRKVKSEAHSIRCLEKAVPALALSLVQGGKDEKLGLAGCEESQSAVSQAGELGRFQPPLRFIDHAANSLQGGIRGYRADC